MASHALRLLASLVGGLGVFCAVETYYQPQFLLYAVAFLVIAITIGSLRAR
jgi:hypothetical protein